jgi:hypothetical protein
MTVLVIVETVILALLTVLVAGLLRAYAGVLARLHRLDGGVDRQSGPRPFTLVPVAPSIPPTPPAADTGFGPAHDIEGETLSGELVHARVVGVEHDTVLLFLSSGCTSCAAFWDELHAPVPLPPHARLLVVAQSASDESVALLAAVAPKGVDVVLSSQAWRDYEVPGAPHVVLVHGPNGRIRGEGTGQSLRQVAELLARATGDASFVAPVGPLPKSARDQRDEAEVDRALLTAGILPGDPRLYGKDPA